MGGAGMIYDRTGVYDRLVDALVRTNRDGEVIVRGDDLAAILTPTAEQRVDDAAAAELRRAMTKHARPYASAHEGWAIILEELEEAADELEPAQDAAADLWSAVRGDNPLGALSAVDELERHAARLVVEAVQVVATCRRFRQDVDGAVVDLDGRHVA